MDPLTIAILAAVFGGIGVAGLTALAERSPRLMSWVKRQFLGLDFLIVGNDDVGKTSFYNYLQFNWFADRTATKDTLRLSPRMSFDVNKGPGREFPIKSSFDIPGPWDADVQVNEVREKAPQVLLVFLSAQYTKEETIFWLSSFLNNLAEAMRIDSKLAGRLKYLAIVLNKVDLISGREANTRISKIQKTTAEILEPSLLTNVRLVDVLPCTLYESEGAEKIAGKVVLSIVEAIRLNQRLVHK